MKTIRIFFAILLFFSAIFELQASDTIWATFKNEDRCKHIRKELGGSWENVGFNTPLLTANTGHTTDVQEFGQLQLQLNADGSYIRIQKSGEASFVDQGLWYLSEDGTQLFFQNTAKQQIDYARIRHLNLDELVLDIPVEGSSEGIRSVFFNKI